MIPSRNFPFNAYINSMQKGQAYEIHWASPELDLTKFQVTRLRGTIWQVRIIALNSA